MGTKVFAGWSFEYHHVLFVDSFRANPGDLFRLIRAFFFRNRNTFLISSDCVYHLRDLLSVHPIADRKEAHYDFWIYNRICGLCVDWPIKNVWFASVDLHYGHRLNFGWTCIRTHVDPFSWRNDRVLITEVP